MKTTKNGHQNTNTLTKRKVLGSNRFCLKTGGFFEYILNGWFFRTRQQNKIILILVGSCTCVHQAARFDIIVLTAIKTIYHLKRMKPHFLPKHTHTHTLYNMPSNNTHTNIHSNISI